MINRKKIYCRVLTTWLHTIASIVVMLVVMVAIIALTARFGGARAVIGILLAGATLSLFVFLLSELIVKVMLRAELPDREKHEYLFHAIDEILRENTWIFPPFFWRPRLYIVKMPEDLPNALAFGWGFVGQYAVAVSQSLYDLMTSVPKSARSREDILALLDDVEIVNYKLHSGKEKLKKEDCLHILRLRKLKAVVAHELGHIRSKDVGLMTLVTIITGGAEQLSKLFTQGKTALGKTPAAFVLGIIIRVFAKFVFPVGRNAISQERERSADALSALYLGTPNPQIEALRLLEREFKRIKEPKEQEEGPLDALFLSHPGMDARVEALESYKS